MRRLCVLTVTFICVMLLAASLRAEDMPTITSSLKDQTILELTVYNHDLGLIKDQRTLKVEKGLSYIRFQGVAANILPQSVQVRSLSQDGSMTILEQNYEYDLLSPQKLLDRYIGKNIKLVTTNPATGEEKVDQAEVLSTINGPVFRVNDEITFSHPGRMVFPSVPEELTQRPTLLWLVESKTSSKVLKIEASYLSTGLSWSADYVLKMNEGEQDASLAGWVTLDNRSGASYYVMKLNLVAGDVNMTQQDAVAFKAPRFAMEMAADQGRFGETPVAEYHMYTLKGQTNLKNNQSKQIALLESPKVRMNRQYVIETTQGDIRTLEHSGGISTQERNVEVLLSFDNTKDNGLGTPLPGGVMRIYTASADGSLQFAGEDTIEHTPKDEPVKLRMGTAFDLKAFRRITSFTPLGGGLYEAKYEIEVRNHKRSDEEVTVIERLPGQWEIVEASHKFKALDASTAQFNVKVGADDVTVLKFKARIRYRWAGLQPDTMISPQ